MTASLSRRWKPLAAAFLVLGLFLLAPAIGLVARMGAAGLGLDGLSPTQAHALWETLILLAGIALIAGSIGIVSAWLVSLYEFPGRRLLEVALVMPLAFPTYLAAFVAVDLLDFFGPVQTIWRWLIGARTARDYTFFDVRSLPGAILVLGLSLFPYVYIPCRIVFQRSGRNIIDAARLLGASGAALFWRVGLPLARVAATGGLVLALIEALNDIGASEYLGVSSLSVLIRDLWLNRGDLAGASRIAGFLVLIVVVLLILDQLARASIAPGRGGAPAPRRVPLAGWPAAAASLAAGLPAVVGFAIPAAFLVSRAAVYGAGELLAGDFFRALGASLTIGIGAAALVCLLATILAIAIRLVRRIEGAAILATIGYAVPGTILVLAILPVLGVADDLLEASGSALLISGSMAAIIYAMGVRFLGIGTSQARLALDRLPANVDHVARLHGFGDIRLGWRVHLPVMLPGLGFGALLVFIDAVKELPATLILRPLNVETLATRAYAQASAGSFERAAIDSLAILAISGLSAWLVARRA